MIASVKGATLEAGKLKIDFPAKSKGGFVRKEVTLTVK